VQGVQLDGLRGGGHGRGRAAALGRRDVVVAWRGTVRSLEWVNDLDFTPVPAAPVLGSAAAAHPRAMVHGGFLSLYTSSNASSKYNKLSARDQASGSMSMTRFLPSLLL
jgi:hypothetical protein